MEVRLDPKDASQLWLIKRFQMAGYSTTSEGLCYGLAFMAIQAMLAGQLEQFNERLEFMRKTDIKAFKLLSSKNPAKILKDSEGLETWWSIRAFMDGVSLYQSPGAFTHLFDVSHPVLRQDPQAVYPLTMPKALGPEDMALAGNFSGVYRQGELAACLGQLRDAILSQRFQGPVCFSLLANEHAIAVGYDSINDRWSIVDANQLPVRWIAGADVSQMESLVFSSFTFNEEKQESEEMKGIATTLLTSAEYKATLQPLMESVQKNEPWKSVHTVTSEKSEWGGEFGESMMSLAAKTGENDLIIELVKRKLNLDKHAGEEDIIYMLRYAAKNNYTELLKKLLPLAADPDKVPTGQKDDEYMRPLQVAAFNGFHDIVKILLDDGRVRLTGVSSLLNEEQDSDLFNQLCRYSPLGLALKEKHNLVATTLLGHPDVNPDQPCTPGGETAFQYAVQDQNYEMVERFLACGKSVNIDGRFPDSEYTPLCDAVWRNDASMTKLLLNNGANPDRVLKLKLISRYTTPEVISLFENITNHFPSSAMFGTADDSKQSIPEEEESKPTLVKRQKNN